MDSSRKGNTRYGESEAAFSNARRLSAGDFSRSRYACQYRTVACSGAASQRAQRVAILPQVDVIGGDLEIGLVRQFIPDHGSKSAQACRPRLQQILLEPRQMIQRIDRQDLLQGLLSLYGLLRSR